MEKHPLNNISKDIKEVKTKKYLYHMVPDQMEGNLIHPLNKLKESENPKLREIYEKVIQKYQRKDRINIPEIQIPTLENTKWGDVIQLTPIHPEDLKKALELVGFENLKEMQFYQIDPDTLDPNLTTIYLYEDLPDEHPGNYTGFNSEKLSQHSIFPEETIIEYKKYLALHGKERMPFLFVNIPHYFVKDSIDVSKLPVLTVNFEKKHGN